jgi:hypothetical protein
MTTTSAPTPGDEPERKKSKQAKGGRARAKALSPTERSEIASNAAKARHAKTAAQGPLPKATHEGTLVIGSVELSCAVLENRQRVLTQSDFMRALGRARQAKGREYYKGDVNLPAFLTANNLKPFIDNDLYVTSSQIVFQPLKGGRAFGYPAELLPRVCEVFLKARDANALAHNQEHIAKQAEILIRGLAAVGIIALVDEASGFQYDRPRRDLEEQVNKFISESLGRWVKAFPAEYFKHLCRLRGVELRADMKLPQYFGTLTNNLVYRRLAPGLVRKLKERREERGSKSNKLHRWLSEDAGLRGVLVHLGMVVGFMKIHSDYQAFEKQLDQVAPIYPEHPGLFDDPKDWEEPS